MRRHTGPGPFDALGLPRRTGLTDDEVRAAWRRVAAATHPDRADGGDPARFAAAAAAYTALRTRAGRGEELARTAERLAVPRLRVLRRAPAAARQLSRVWRGRPGRLALRCLATAAAAAAAVITAGWHPATAAVITGLLTWLVLSGRRDLAPPPGSR